MAYQILCSQIRGRKCGWVSGARTVPRLRDYKTSHHIVTRSDGMAERHIGFVKRVIRCLMLERHIEKGSWPSLLQEITFYGNNLDNASNKISPPMLAFGRQPRSPIDMLMSTGNTQQKLQDQPVSISKQR